jgi:hypothetical protein
LKRSVREWRAIHAKSRLRGPGPVRVKATGPTVVDGYTLRRVEGRNGPLFFFARDSRKGEAVSLPRGFEVHRNARTGVPYVARQDAGQERFLAAVGRRGGL